MSITEIITTEEARKGFYPTPPSVADILLADVDWYKVGTVLEPSAGKGDLLRSAIRLALGECSYNEYCGEYHRSAFEADAVEIDPYLRSIVRYELGGEKLKEIAIRISEIDRTTREDTPEVKAERKALMREKAFLKAATVRLVHDDFLTMDTRKSYDLIIMNPPFANGDEHLLKAIEMQRRTGGEIRCILNAETLLNPYTNRRKVLQAQLAEIGAEVSFIDGAFLGAERQTDVSIAIVKASLPKVEYESNIYNRLREAAEMEEMEPEEVTDLAVTDFLELIVSQYKVEVDAGLELIREYQALKPRIGSAITLTIGDKDKYSPLNLNGYVKCVRQMYWEKLFSNPQFMAKLTSNLKDKYRGMVGKMGDYDFSLFNIQQIMTEMNAELAQGVQDTIVALFDRLTEQYSWYPEMQKNIHYYNGWKTNKVHKINSKVILPIHGLTADPYWSRDTINVRKAEETIGDIEKVFDFLDGNMTADVDLHGVLERANEEKQTKNIPCKYFSVTLYKKGTMHIKFHSQELVDRFNVYCCRKKNWLPPNYGKTAYTDLTAEEKAVIDGFDGDGTEGSGEKAYREVCAKSAYYLGEPVRNMPALMAGA